jgi:predicted NBD/HSP70 family sugar kinase
VRPGTNQEHSKNYNRRVVLEVIRLHEPISRAEIARQVGLTAQTIANIVEELILEGVVVTRGRRQGLRGQPALELEFNPNGAFSVGLHLDRDLLTAVLVNLKGEQQRIERRHASFATPEEAYPFMCRAVESLIAEEQISRERVWGIGLAMPGPIQAPNAEPSAPTDGLNWVRGPIRDLLEHELGLPVFAENDATAAAIGEHWYAANRDIKSFFYVYFGLGLGGGMISHGQTYQGFAGNAIEFGHIPVRHDGPICKCGGRGCLELYTATNSMREFLQARGLHVSSEAELVNLSKRDQRHLEAWLDHSAQHLAPALVTIENLFDPELIVLGGRLPRAMLDGMVVRLERLVPPLRMQQKPYRPPIVGAEVGEDAAALGAATLPIFESLAPNHGQLLKHPPNAPNPNAEGGEFSPKEPSKFRPTIQSNASSTLNPNSANPRRPNA